MSLCTLLNKKQRGTVEPSFQEKLREKYKTCSEFLVKERIEIFNEEKK